MTSLTWSWAHINAYTISFVSVNTYLVFTASSLRLVHIHLMCFTCLSVQNEYLAWYRPASLRLWELLGIGVKGWATMTSQEWHPTLLLACPFPNYQLWLTYSAAWMSDWFGQSTCVCAHVCACVCHVYVCVCVYAYVCFCEKQGLHWMSRTDILY